MHVEMRLFEKKEDRISPALEGLVEDVILFYLLNGIVIRYFFFASGYANVKIEFC